MSVFRSVLGACVLLGSCASSLALAGGAEGLQRVKVDLVAPPLVHPHEQVVSGPPKVVQGMVRYLEERLAVVQAGVSVILTLPAEDTAFDLTSGPVMQGNIINATLLPGGTFELARAAVARA